MSLKCIVFLYVIKYIIVNDCFVICVGSSLLSKTVDVTPTMHKPKRLCRNQLSICKKAEILCRILYDKVWLQDICDEFDLPASTVCTWKKNSDKILADSVKAGKKKIRMHHSKYKDIKLALLYWIKDMRSRDHPPPLSKGILKAKAEQQVHYVVLDL